MENMIAFVLLPTIIYALYINCREKVPDSLLNQHAAFLFKLQFTCIAQGLHYTNQCKMLTFILSITPRTCLICRYCVVSKGLKALSKIISNFSNTVYIRLITGLRENPSYPILYLIPYTYPP